MSSGSLTTRLVEKVWGRDVLPAPFSAPQGQRIGEIWFAVPPPLGGMLTKYLFTSEKLSVQVHPGEGQAVDGGAGKEECWLVLDAEPGASIALGFRQAVDAETIAAAALDGSIERLLDWREVAPGDFFYLPAGTVHAMGAGLAVVEVQQDRDITYRLYDYGRPRELHLDDALRVLRGEVYPAALQQHIAPDETRMLVDGPYFRLAQVGHGEVAGIAANFPGAVQLLPLAGEVVVDGTPIASGGCGWAAQLAEADFSRSKRCLIAAPVKPT